MFFDYHQVTPAREEAAVPESITTEPFTTVESTGSTSSDSTSVDVAVVQEDTQTAVVMTSNISEASVEATADSPVSKSPLPDVTSAASLPPSSFMSPNTATTEADREIEDIFSKVSICDDDENSDMNVTSPIGSRFPAFLGKKTYLASPTATPKPVTKWVYEDYEASGAKDERV